MTAREKEIKHFAHEHSLIFKELEEIPFCCNACGLPVLLSPSYICTIQGCSFYLHEPCTRLPDKLSHRVGDELHDLHLHANARHENCKCSKCGKICKNFTYHCYECCEFALDPLCGYPLDIQIENNSHKDHPMVAICKEFVSLCDVCGREHKGFFFNCHRCNFLIHQDCALLPSLLRVGCHPHPLSLTSSGKLSAIYLPHNKCLICEKDTSRLFGAYTCTHCRRIAHVDCAVSKLTENPGKIHVLPALDDAFLSLMMCAVLEENATPESNGEMMLEKYHTARSLILSNDTHESVCNSCIRPIAPPYYSCYQSARNFLLHKFCADLPLVINDLFNMSRHLVFPRCNEFFSLFFCKLCVRSCNGFGYSSDDYGEPDIFHLECALAPKFIKHDSHMQHPLILGGRWFENIISCCGKRNPFYYDNYSCSQCAFSIHIRCALLPKTVTHKFDKHPLTLVIPSSAQDSGDDHLCEFCEEDINPSYWFYRCVECDDSFHVECIPSTGEYSRIKFGDTVVLPCHGDHPLTLVRMLSVGSQTCGYCHNIIKGFKDGMTLHCAECDFWVHFKCGKTSSGVMVSCPYDDLSYLSE